MPTLRFGKYRGQDIRDVPTEYVEFLLEGAERTVMECREELARRRAVDESQLPVAQQIIECGYRELAKRHHPDLGGSSENMRAVNAAIEGLRELIRAQEST